MRTDVALSHEDMINISAQAGHSQPCDTFGVHSSLPLLAELFKEGQAAFVANIGNLVEPVTRSSYEDGSAQLPPQIGAHNVQKKVAQNLHAQDASSKGVLGRMLDALSRQAFNTGGFSITGSLPKILEGESVADHVKWVDTWKQLELAGAPGVVLEAATAVRSGATVLTKQERH